MNPIRMAGSGYSIVLGQLKPQRSGFTGTRKTFYWGVEPPDINQKEVMKMSMTIIEIEIRIKEIEDTFKEREGTDFYKTAIASKLRDEIQSLDILFERMSRRN